MKRSIQHKRLKSWGAKPTAAQLERGELVLNTTSKVIFSKNENDQVIEMGVPFKAPSFKESISIQNLFKLEKDGSYTCFKTDNTTGLILAADTLKVRKVADDNSKALDVLNTDSDLQAAKLKPDNRTFIRGIQYAFTENGWAAIPNFGVVPQATGNFALKIAGGKPTWEKITLPTARKFLDKDKNEANADTINLVSSDGTVDIIATPDQINFKAKAGSNVDTSKFLASDATEKVTPTGEFVFAGDDPQLSRFEIDTKKSNTLHLRGLTANTKLKKHDAANLSLIFEAAVGASKDKKAFDEVQLKTANLLQIVEGKQYKVYSEYFAPHSLKNKYNDNLIKVTGVGAAALISPAKSMSIVAALDGAKETQGFKIAKASIDANNKKRVDIGATNVDILNLAAAKIMFNGSELKTGGDPALIGKVDANTKAIAEIKGALNPNPNLLKNADGHIPSSAGRYAREQAKDLRTEASTGDVTDPAPIAKLVDLSKSDADVVGSGKGLEITLDPSTAADKYLNDFSWAYVAHDEQAELLKVLKSGGATLTYYTKMVRKDGSINKDPALIAHKKMWQGEIRQTDDFGGGDFEPNIPFGGFKHKSIGTRKSVELVGDWVKTVLNFSAGTLNSIEAGKVIVVGGHALTIEPSNSGYKLGKAIIAGIKLEKGSVSTPNKKVPAVGYEAEIKSLREELAELKKLVTV